MTAKQKVKQVYPRAKDIRCQHDTMVEGYIELWSEGEKKGILLSHGRSRIEAYEKAAAKI